MWMPRLSASTKRVTVPSDSRAAGRARKNRKEAALGGKLRETSSCRRSQADQGGMGRRDEVPCVSRTSTSLFMTVLSGRVC